MEDQKIFDGTDKLQAYSLCLGCWVLIEIWYNIVLENYVKFDVPTITNEKRRYTFFSKSFRRSDNEITGP